MKKLLYLSLALLLLTAPPLLAEGEEEQAKQIEQAYPDVSINHNDTACNG